MCEHVKGESKQRDEQHLCVWGVAKRCPGTSTLVSHTDEVDLGVKEDL